MALENRPGGTHPARWIDSVGADVRFAFRLLLGLPISVIGWHRLGANGTNPDTTPNGALVGGIVAIVVLAVALVATSIPATRAARVNPVTALSSE